MTTASMPSSPAWPSTSVPTRRQPSQSCVVLRVRAARSPGTSGTTVTPDFFLNRYWQAAELEGVPGSADERDRWPVCTDAGIAALLTSHPGAVRGSLVIDTPFGSHDDLWDGFLLGIGPAGAHLAGLADDDRARLRNRLRVVVDHAGGPEAMTARALTFCIPVP